jgi:predicted phosphate transport protein (TIGR00153 family)
MNVAIEATYELKPFFQAVKKGDWEAAIKSQQTIVEIEHRADHIKKEVRSHLPKSLFLPVSRGDILAMISAQDKVANQAKDIAGLILGRKMEIPATMQALFDQLLEQSIAACHQAKKAIDELDELLESGFRGNEIHVVDTMIDKLDQIEHETDDIQISLRSELFNIERELYAVDVIFLYKAIETVGGLADHAHEIGGKLQALLAH